VVRMIPAAPAVTPPPRKPAAKVTKIAPPPPPKRVPASPAANQRRLATVRSPKAWKQKLASRPPPADAKDMVPRLKEIFRKEGVPPEWVWLAEVESSMNPRARSPVGAVGLYQFMPGTARSLGLKTSPTDERLVPEKSASAAARYLKYLHGRFDSWPLALAAYNAGEGNVGKALKKTSNKTFEGIQDFLPLETQMYVPKVMATVSLREGVDAATLPPPTAWHRWPGGVCLAAWVRAD
jgi:membrane-bound lytic murein transglycosylase D